MSTFSVSYDLLKPGKDYATLLTRLRNLGAVRVLKSQWVMQNECSAVALRDDLLKHMDTNDRLLVINTTSNSWAWHNLEAVPKTALGLT